MREHLGIHRHALCTGHLRLTTWSLLALREAPSMPGFPQQPDLDVQFLCRTSHAVHGAVVVPAGPGTVHLRIHPCHPRCRAHDDAANCHDVRLCTEDPRTTGGDSTRVCIIVCFTWATVCFTGYHSSPPTCWVACAAAPSLNTTGPSSLPFYPSPTCDVEV